MKQTICMAMILAGPAAFAQPPQQVEDVIVERVGPPAGVPFGFAAGRAADVKFISSEFSWEANAVKGAPYSAEAVTETVQRLADGNRIARKNTAQIWRDSEGRTRREETLDAIGPWASGQPHKMIFINDPVAGINYTLNPQTKTADKIEVGKPHMMPLASGEGDVRKMMTARGEFVQAMPAPPTAGVAGARAIIHSRISATPVPPNEKVNHTSLGQQNIEGVLAQGNRSVVTIPAGQIGNEREIEILSERWVSPELQTVVLSKRSDPRFGETTYKLTEIQRAEPARSLFEVPADYEIRDAGVMRLDFKTKEDKE